MKLCLEKLLQLFFHISAFLISETDLVHSIVSKPFLAGGTIEALTFLGATLEDF